MPGSNFQRLTFPLMSQLYSIGLMLAQNKRDAENLVQETYVRAFKDSNRFKAGTNTQGWMIRILTNTYFAGLNQQQKEHYRSNRGSSSSVRLASERVGFQQSYLDLFSDPITSALDKLPSECRMVVLLRDICDLTYNEIAELLACSTDMVMSLLSRGRRMLVGSIAEDGNWDSDN